MSLFDTPICTIPDSCFLHGFIEDRIEMPADGHNGNCIVHYQGNHKDYKMIVRLVDGKREGRAILSNNGSSYIKLEYTNGVLTGDVERLNAYLEIELKGRLFYGAERGVFEEYNTDGRVIWRGYYRDGKRFSRLVESDRMRGYFEERSVKNGLLLTIAQYDDRLREKSGRCFEFLNGLVKRECLFVNGGVNRIVREFNDGVILPNAIQENSTSTYLSSLCGEPNDDCMLVYDYNSESGYGVVRKDEKCYEIQWSTEGDKVIAVDLIVNTMNGYMDRKLIMTECENGTIDLDVNGRRWEGGVKDGKPFGYGMMFDEEGRLEYDGFMINQVKVCFGKEYYYGIEAVKYCGCYFDDRRFGYGTLYDRNGRIDYDGLWKNDEPYSHKSYDLMLVSHVEELRVSNGSCKLLRPLQRLPYFQSLKRITIGKDSFRGGFVFAVEGLSELESIVIESNCFVNSKGWKYDPSDDVRVFRIQNCPKLVSLQIGDRSFKDYNLFSLDTLPSLQTIQIGQHCFCRAMGFNLDGEVKWLDSI